MVNFMYQPDWAMEFLDIWSNIFLGLSVWCFWMQLAFKLALVD
jgi:hypothetical protein